MKIVKIDASWYTEEYKNYSLYTKEEIEGFTEDDFPDHEITFYDISSPYKVGMLILHKIPYYAMCRILVKNDDDMRLVLVEYNKACKDPDLMAFWTMKAEFDEDSE